MKFDSPQEAQEYMRRCVTLGAILLDAKKPVWHNIVNEAMINGRFYIQHWDSCIAGSLELVRHFDDNDRRVEIGTFFQLNGETLVGEEYGEMLGFVVPNGGDDDNDWNLLEEFWTEEINDRINNLKT